MIKTVVLLDVRTLKNHAIYCECEYILAAAHLKRQMKVKCDQWFITKIIVNTLSSIIIIGFVNTMLRC